MTGLLALAKTLLANAAATHASDLPIGTLDRDEPYAQLRYADVEGIGTVTIDRTGNMIGFSPVERCTAKGETAWIPLPLCRNLRLQPFLEAAPIPTTTR